MEAEERSEWQAPPPPERIEVEQEQPQMSEVATLANIFFEPGATFEDLKRKPRFILASIIIALLTTAFAFGIAYKVGDEGMRRFMNETFDKNPQTASMSAEQRSQAIEMQLTISKYSRFALPIIMFIMILLGGLLYWLGAKAFGGTGNFLHGVSVWVYSWLPPLVVGMLANFIALIFKSADDIDIASSQRGIVQANPSFLFGADASPVLVTLVSVLDLFAIWGWVLAAIGLRITNRLSSGSAWAVVLILALIGITMRVFFAFIGGAPA